MLIKRLCRTLKYAIASVVLSFTASHAMAGMSVIPLPEATVGQNYSADLLAAAKTGGYPWLNFNSVYVVLKSGTLPSGLSLNSATGFLTGTPTAAGIYGNNGEWTFDFKEQPAPGDGMVLYYQLITNLPTGPSSADTQVSLQNTLAALRGVYALQNHAISSGLTYDCTAFDAKGVCVSAGGRYQRINDSDLNTNHGLLVGALSLSEQWRVGAWFDQGSSANTGTGVRLHNGSPLFGLFGVWSQRPVQEGWEARIAAGYGNNDLTATRGVVGTSEAGSGTTRMNTQGASVVVSYHVPLATNWRASPSAGVRYTKVKANGYAEEAAAGVTSPLTFEALSQQSTTALAGLRVSGSLVPRVRAFGSVGVEHDLQVRGGEYVAAGVSGLTAESLNANVRKTKPTASAGIAFDVAKAQQLSVGAMYRSEAFRSVSSWSAMTTYTVGF